MKQVFFLLLLSVGLTAQVDTIYSDLTPVRSKKTTIKVTSITGDEITEKREVIDYDKAVKKMERITQDTAQYTQYLKNITDMEKNLIAEKRRVRMMRRDAVGTLERLNKILAEIKV
ncbi:MAG: hypothetical protein KA234_01025 [Saprospiraceae bacterium]|nr:hypothetical protein [Saprospiraceae bacterium]